ncbi:hypothetical protein H632_c1260p0, partial [Helicosporidium sp. ATCC 50920]
RVERCERVQVIAAARTVAVNTCHDCILYLGVNRPPVLLGDNRFVQLAPYNATYECLPRHMRAAGVQPLLNKWDAPVSAPADRQDRKDRDRTGLLGSSSSVLGSGALALRTGASGTFPSGSLGSGPVLSGGSAAARDGGTPPQPLQQQAAPMEGVETGSPRRPLSIVTSRALGSPGESPGAAPETPSSARVEEAGAPAVPGAPPSVSVLPPAKLLPFLVPFRGGMGPLCGGPLRLDAADRTARDSLSSFLSGGEWGSSSFPSSPFPLPADYQDAWDERMKAAAAVRTAVKAANLDDDQKRDLMNAIQVHFKDWLQATGNMRQTMGQARSKGGTHSGKWATRKSVVSRKKSAVDEPSPRSEGDVPDNVIHIHVNNELTPMELYATEPGCTEIRYPTNIHATSANLQPPPLVNPAAASVETVADLRRLEKVGMGLDFSPGDPFIGMLTLDLQAVTGVDPTARDLYVVIADADDKTEAFWGSRADAPGSFAFAHPAGARPKDARSSQGEATSPESQRHLPSRAR